MTNKDNTPKALVLEIQRMSTEDGPGIRTTVFFKGCNLKCIWCHNPESISLKPQVHWVASRCIGCKTCLEVCPDNALSHLEKGVSINRSICKGCGKCAEECPATAMELLGKEWSIKDLTAEVIKDRAFFEKSKGGITVSGGEPGMQVAFVAQFLKGLRELGLHTALDTCGLCTTDTLDRLLPHASMVLFDIKESNPEKHKRFTGTGNENILKNLIHVAEYIKASDSPLELWIRTPIIPDATAEKDNITGIGKFIAKNLNGVVKRWELCAFNNFCQDKYKRLDRKWIFEKSPLLKKEIMEDLAEVAGNSGVNSDIVHWSGPTRLEKETQ